MLDALGFGWVDDLDQFEMRPATLEAGGVVFALVVSRSGWSNQGGAELVGLPFADTIGR